MTIALTRTDLATQVRVAVLRLSRRLRAERDTSVSEAQFSVLAAVCFHGSLTPGELAAHEQVRPPSMTRTIDGLEAAGLVERTRTSTDGRRVDVAPTAAGRAIVERTAERRNAWLEVRLAELTDDERATLADAAGIIARMVAR